MICMNDPIKYAQNTVKAFRAYFFRYLVIESYPLRRYNAGRDGRIPGMSWAVQYLFLHIHTPDIAMLRFFRVSRVCRPEYVSDMQENVHGAVVRFQRWH